jgi:two-component sensor histidine kinase/CHASE1-domain containing sensor protein
MLRSLRDAWPEGQNEPRNSIVPDTRITLSPSSWRPLRLPALVAFPILVFSVLLSWQMYDFDRQVEQARVDNAVSLAESRLANHLGMLEGLRGMVLGGGRVDRESLRAYLSSVRAGDLAPGMTGIGFALAAVGSPAEIEAVIARDYGIDRRVFPEMRGGIAFPVTILEPESERNRVALGYDMYSEAQRRAAMDKAWETGRAAASPIIRLLQDAGDEGQPGLLIYLPLPADDSQGAATAPGRPPIRGFVYAPVRIGDFFRNALEPVLGDGLGFHVIAMENGRRLELFADGPLSGVRSVRPLDVVDRTWLIEVYDPYGGYLHTRSFRALFFGGLIALLAAMLTYAQARRARSLAILARERQERAQEKDLLLAEMNHRLKNSLARLSALVGITIRDSGDLADFEQRFAGRFRSLAATQSLVTAAPTAAIGIGPLLEAELQSTGHAGTAGVDASGEDLLLDEATAQTIGLVLHELVTNSVKYGALGHGGRLNVRWQVDGADTRIDWREDGLAPGVLPSGEGFGTGFVRKMVERQLRGSFERRIGDGRVEVDLRWPKG